MFSYVFIVYSLISILQSTTRCKNRNPFAALSMRYLKSNLYSSSVPLRDVSLRYVTLRYNHNLARDMSQSPKILDEAPDAHVNQLQNCTNSKSRHVTIAYIIRRCRVPLQSVS